MKDHQQVKKNGVSQALEGKKQGQNRQLFGTDGVRGVANLEPMTSEMALKLGRALAYVFRDPERMKKSAAGADNSSSEEHRYRILIGKDTRLSGYMIETALASGISHRS